jgi:type I restriction enzyme S subunit
VSKWEIVMLGEIGDFYTGGTPSRKRSDFFEGIHPWITTPALGATNIDASYANALITDEAIQKSATKLIPANSLMIGVRVGIGKASINTCPMCTNQDIVSISNIDTARISLEYLHKYIATKKEFLDSQKRGATIQGIKIELLKNLTIPLPPLQVQQQIADTLDHASDLIEKRKSQIEKLDLLVKSQFIEMFGDPGINPKGWGQAALKDIGIGKLAYGSGASSCEYDGIVRYVRITDIENNGELNANLVSPSVIDERYLLNEGDILFARSGATVGKTYRYRESDGKCLFAGYLIRLIPDWNKVLPDYVFYFTKTGYYESFISANAKIVAQPNINAKQYGELAICVPPLSLQSEFAGFVQQVEAQKSLFQQSLAKLELNYKSLMQKCFRGEIF